MIVVTQRFYQDTVVVHFEDKEINSVALTVLRNILATFPYIKLSGSQGQKLTFLTAYKLGQ